MVGPFSPLGTQAKHHLLEKCWPSNNLKSPPHPSHYLSCCITYTLFPKEGGNTTSPVPAYSVVLSLLPRGVYVHPSPSSWVGLCLPQPHSAGQVTLRDCGGGVLQPGGCRVVGKPRHRQRLREDASTSSPGLQGTPARGQMCERASHQ